MWRDFATGWRQARWAWYFALYLLPILGVTLLLVRFLPGGWDVGSHVHPGRQPANLEALNP